MDCEKFELHVIDALYDELDEVTYAAMKRHMDGCSRCAGILHGLRATRDVGVLPIEEPSDELEARILDAAAAAQRTAPWHKKAVRAIAWAGSHAMRPQLAMAAVLVLMLGSSLLLLRAKPGTVGIAPVRVTERGAPAPETTEGQGVLGEPREEAAAPALAAPSPVAAATAGVSERDRGAVAGTAADEAKGGSDKDEAGKKVQGADDALADARSTRASGGCSAAVGKYDSIGSRYPRTAAATTAMVEAAECYKSMGEESKAREIWLALRGVEAHRERADDELRQASSAYGQQQKNSAASGAAGRPGSAAGAARAAAPASPAKARAVEAQAAEPPAATPPQATPPATASGGAGSSAGQRAAPQRKAIDDASGF